MKKCMLLLILGFLPFATFAQSPGDTNHSGSVDIVDALLIAQAYVGLNPSNYFPSEADVDCSGSVDIVDALLVAQLYVGLISSFPCQATPAPTPGGSISIACGSSSAVGSFQADQYYTGGTAYNNTNTIDVSLITDNPPPAALFNNERYGAMSYTIPGFTAGGTYAVTLYFAETYLTSSGGRVFNVSINGTAVLTNFDIYANAGAQNKAIALAFTTTADGSGQIVIQFTAVTENPKINGIGIQPGTAPTTGPTAVPTTAPTAAPGGTWHCFLLLGQSNMAGFPTAQSSDKVQNPRIMVLGFDNCGATGSQTNVWRVAVPPLHECGPGAIGPGDWFSKTIIDKYPAGDTVALLPCAFSGEKIETMMQGGTHWSTIIQRAQLGQQKGPIEGFLFNQGESNSGDSSWPGKVQQFVSQLKSTLGLGNIPFLPGELLYSGSCAGMNTYINQLPSLITNCYVISASGLVVDPTDTTWHLHFGHDSQVTFGQRYAAAMISALHL
jgi:hypothetical protein